MRAPVVQSMYSRAGENIFSQGRCSPTLKPRPSRDLSPYTKHARGHVNIRNKGRGSPWSSQSRPQERPSGNRGQVVQQTTTLDRRWMASTYAPEDHTMGLKCQCTIPWPCTDTPLRLPGITTARGSRITSDSKQGRNASHTQSPHAMGRNAEEPQWPQLGAGVATLDSMNPNFGAAYICIYIYIYM